jgi:hypothetical protein
MKKAVLWILFVIFLILIISPIDFAPGPIDDIVYGIFDLVIVALLGGLRDRKRLAKEGPPPGGEVIEHERKAGGDE